MQANRHRQVVQARTSNGMCRKAVWIGDCPVVDGQWTVSIWADIWQLVSERQSRAIWCWKHTTQMWLYVQEIFSVVSKADIKCRWSSPTYIKILWLSFLKYENWISEGEKLPKVPHWSKFRDTFRPCVPFRDDFIAGETGGQGSVVRQWLECGVNSTAITHGHSHVRTRHLLP